jgi:hypothetical protein
MTSSRPIRRFVLAVLLGVVAPERANAEPELAGEWRFEVEGGAVNALIEQDGAKLTLKLKGSNATETLTGKIQGSRIEVSRAVESRDLELAGGTAECRSLAQSQLASLNQDERFRRRVSLDLGASGQITGRYETQPELSCQGDRVQLGAARQIDVRLVPLCAPLAGPLPVGAPGGPFSARIALSQTLKAIPRDKDTAAREGWCHYRGYGVAALNVSTGDLPGGTGTFAVSVPIASADLDVYFKAGGDRADPGAYRDIHLSYADSGTDTLAIWKATPSFPFDFVLDAVGVVFSIDDAGTAQLMESYLEVRMDVGAEVQLGGPVYLAGDLTVPIRYTWRTGARSWTDGAWSLQGLAAVELQVRREGRHPVASAALGVDTSGKLTANLTLTGEARWAHAGYALELRQCSLAVRVDLNEFEWEIVRGSLDGGFEAGAPVSGSFAFKIAYEGAALRMAIASDSPVRAFGVPIQQLALAADLDPNTLLFQEVSGSVAFAHPELDQRLAIRSFRVREGALVEFLGDGRAAYKGFMLAIERIRYAGSDASQLELTAVLSLGWSATGTGAVDVRNLSIDASGKISKFEINASVAATPVEVTLQAALAESELRGRFAGTFAGAASFDGQVVIGARPTPDDFRYGYLSMALELRKGIPLGQTGLTLLGLNGAFGCNYLPAGSPLSVPAGPRRDIYYLQAGLTVGDLGELARLNGTLSLVLGPQNSAVQIAGRLQLTQRQPYMVGMVTANYVFGGSNVNGVLSSDIRLPASGSAVRAEKNVLIYRLENGAYSVMTPGSILSAELFGVVKLSQGNIRLEGELSRPIDSMRGVLSGRMNAHTDVVIGWPASFAPWGDGSGAGCSRVRRRAQVLDCDCSSGTDSALGVGAVGGLTLTLLGNLDAALGSTGPTGTFGMNAYFAGSAAITLPTSGWFGEPCARTLALEASSNLQGTAQRELLLLRGDVRFVDGSGNELFQMDFEQTL